MANFTNGCKSLREYLDENRIDVDQLNILLERYINKECQDGGVMAENYQLFVYKEIISNFIGLITKEDGN
jgi:hypothetical protein